MPKISIIIPVYGVEKYIERCAVSIFEQTNKDFEMVFINDCSKDNSEVILLDVISRYKGASIDVRIIQHEVNKGISATRETGLNKAKGEYILYVDSDDYIAPNMVELMVARANDTNADIIYSDYYDLKNGELIYQNQSLSVRDPLLITASMLRSEIVWTPWNKIFKKSLATVHNIHWPININVGEDLVVMSKLFANAKEIEYVNQALYIYNRDNVNSYINSWSVSSCQQSIKAVESVNAFFSDEFPNADLIKSLDKVKLASRYQMLYTFDKNLYKLIPDTFPETDDKIFTFENTSFYWKVALFLVVKKKTILATSMTRAIFLLKKTRAFIQS
ncbi:glycosyltransferase family 2 protein [Methylotenera versatilis]|uniref:Glycosyl transferase family 2 n=1 Tax=Methylotenera versatilis (strain 301) TaxID=666681 RepID=D7DLF8_METV0|nr:glycosyltransferase family 2 protein [Methylotenera versatilis]ADI30629.1 glycosyl transferase family 2 [Methylotenera versatilis 301]